MKKRNLATLAMVGISAGLIVGGCQKKDDDRRNGNKMSAAEHQRLSPDMKAFYNSLSPEGQRKFMQLDAQHRMMAMEMVNQNCNGKNKCAGMGGCSTADHSCAGENSCKGQGGSMVDDPDKAVGIQLESQKDQRQRANGQMQNQQRRNNR